MSRHTIAGLALLLLSGIGVQAQYVQGPWKFKLVRPETGWLLKDDQLLWTENNGAEWKDISPELAAEGHIAAVFFLDARHGWCLLHEFNSDAEGRTALEIAATDDGGGSWSRVSLAASDTLLQQAYGSSGEIAFADTRNGWVKLTLGSSSASSWSALLRTSDRGRTWSRLPNPPVNGYFGMLANEFGWLAGGVLSDELYLTIDGGHNWVRSEVGVVRPKADYVQVNFCRPGFEDPRQGVLPVRFVLGDQMTLIVYSTRNGGASWQMQSTVRNIPARGLVETAVVGSRVMIAKSTPSGGVELGDGASSFPLTMPAPMGPWLAVDEIDFIDALNGWFAVRSEVCADRNSPCSMTRALLATFDGGHTLIPIYIQHSTRVHKSRAERGEGPKVQ